MVRKRQGGEAIRADSTYDVVVVGSGAGGMSAAVISALEGLRVLVVESTGHLGGTTAYSAGTAWVPGTRFGPASDSATALAYLDNAVGNCAPRQMRMAFLEAAPRAIHRLIDEAGLRFRARPRHPDYLSEVEGSAEAGRAIEPEPFRADALGRDLKLIRPAIPEFTILGGLQVDRDDIAHLLRMGKSLRSLGYSLRLIGTYLADRLRYGRSARLVMGNALIGRLLLAARDRGVEFRLNTRVTGIEPGTPAVLRLDGGERLTAERGVILATGGFARHPERRAEMLPAPLAEHSPAAPGHTGDMHDIALGLGARYGQGAASNVYWAPVSKTRRKDGTTAVFPHFVFDRSKPGTLAVGADGRRFTNEARSYHEFALAQYATGTIPAFLVTDAEGLGKYGLGMVRPGGMGAKALIRDGYLLTADTLDGLAARAGIDAQGLSDTVARMNAFAASGTDDDFHRGDTVYERFNGDGDHGPNPTLGPVATPPFYAVRLWPGDIGAATGLVTDTRARVLDASDRPIPGLYACGNDMQSIMGGVYPGPGITIGPAIAFGYLAAMDAARREGTADA